VTLDVDALLRRIGLTAQPPATAAGLRTVHRAYVSRVPYEDIAVQLGESRPLDVEALAARICHGGRGGYCFEVNGVFGALLEALGFAVTRHESVVAERGSDEPTNHLALSVEVEGRTYLAEAGWGEGWLDPLPLEPGVHRAGPLSWSVEPEPGGWWIGQHEWGATPGLFVSAAPATLDDFQPHHTRLSTAPESPFVRTLVVQQPHDDHVTTLRARTLSRVGPGRDERTVLPDAGAFADTLRSVFGIDPAALGPARMERLWTRACAQHEEWLASRGRAA
jgi:N-hydroxyarylamine O-acetyltransferase